MKKLINPATNRPFNEVAPDDHIQRLRRAIIRVLEVRNKYDAAQTTHRNELHWGQADNLSPNSANRLAVRKPLRERSRYEVANNGYLKGIGLSLAHDFVGSGPTLQITDPRFNETQRSIIERKFNKEYSKKIKLRSKLWRLRFAKFQDGEGFKFVTHNRQLNHAIKYDYRIFECDQISSFISPSALSNRGKIPEIDGVRFDRQSGEPTHYYLLNEHPGETEIFNYLPTLEGQWVPASQVIHWFRQDRPWLRGIPETTPTLPLWALLRRYTLAVVQNAEIAADFTVLLKSMQLPNVTPFPLGEGGQPSASNPEDWFDSYPIDRGLMTVLPSQYDLTQLDPKQPVTMYDTFVNALVQEASRPLLTPRNQALGNSGGYNMASGALDRQSYRQAINQERFDCNEVVLDRCLDTWWFEAIRIPQYFDEEYATTSPVYEVTNRFMSFRIEPPEHTWRWDEVPEHTDPVKVAQAIDILFKGNHLSEKDIQEGRFNRSVDEHHKNLEQQYKWHEQNPSPEAKAAQKASENKALSLKSKSKGKPKKSSKEP